MDNNQNGKAAIDTDIDICFDGIRVYFVSGVQQVSDLHLFKQYRAALARIAELEKGQAHTFDGASTQEQYHSVMTSGRMP